MRDVVSVEDENMSQIGPGNDGIFPVGSGGGYVFNFG